LLRWYAPDHPLVVVRSALVSSGAGRVRFDRTVADFAAVAPKPAPPVTTPKPAPSMKDLMPSLLPDKNKLPAPPKDLTPGPAKPGVSVVPAPLQIGNPVTDNAALRVQKGDKAMTVEGTPEGGGVTVELPLPDSTKPKPKPK
jgi:hypothetical protein